MHYTQARRLIATIAAIGVLTTGFAPASFAAMIGTNDAIALESRDRQVARISAWLTESSVREQLERLGVDPADAQARVAGLTDRELMQLDSRIDEMNAGGIDAIGVLGILFLVLLILELVGVTDIFKRI